MMSGKNSGPPEASSQYDRCSLSSSTASFKSVPSILSSSTRDLGYHQRKNLRQCKASMARGYSAPLTEPSSLSNSNRSLRRTFALHGEDFASISRKVSQESCVVDENAVDTPR
uniref:Uncharacterized protein n=1 Tax=Timspurckia oligopyrenoides TaxID=708627 RepID=A0A7S0ZGE2_9RHOD|mmetsp:Transcript_4233/g.7424  ORF Transcript_4233/g.7424 Transcript_4233/m.7424 type:complete len:113 (+) Transcript_4233:255-593(+)